MKKIVFYISAFCIQLLHAGVCIENNTSYKLRVTVITVNPKASFDRRDVKNGPFEVTPQYKGSLQGFIDTDETYKLYFKVEAYGKNPQAKESTQQWFVIWDSEKAFPKYIVAGGRGNRLVKVFFKNNQFSIEAGATDSCPTK